MGSMTQGSLLKGPTEGNKSQGKRPHQFFSELASANPSSLALLWQDELSETKKMTMMGLDKESNRLARGILHYCGREVAPNKDGDRVVMIHLPPSRQLVSSILAIWKAGASYLPIEPPAPQERVNHILMEAKPHLVIAQNDRDSLLFPSVKMISFDALMQISAEMKDGPLMPEEQYPLSHEPIDIILYTSGSTGLSKGVRIKSSSIMNRLEWQWREFPFSAEEETCCFKTSITFVDSVAELWAPLLNPGRPLPLLILPKTTSSNPQLLIPLLNNYNVGRLVLVPTLLKSILTYLKITNDTTSLRRLRTWVCSGEILPCSLAEEFFDWSERNGSSHVLCNFYGSTEVMGDVTFYIMQGKENIGNQGKVPIGGPVDNTVLYLLDPGMKLVKPGDIGELYVAGKHVAAGYVNGRDSFRFIENPYAFDTEYKTLFRTGDYARIEKNTLLFEGRTDSQIKVRGNRVDLSEVEAAISKLTFISKAIVLCYSPNLPEQELIGFVLLEEGLSLTSHQIQKELANSLPQYAIPQIVIIEKIPLLVNGKVDRQELLHYYNRLAKEERDNEMEFELTGIREDKKSATRCLFSAIASLLPHARTKLSPTANFYQIGGNSLNSVLVIAKLSEEGYSINITEFISSETLMDIVMKMVPKNSEQKEGNKTVLGKFKYDIIGEKYKADIYRIIGDSFFEKADIELTLDPPIKRYEYNELLDAIWPSLLEQRLSIVVMDVNSEKVISTSLVFDAENEPPVELKSRLRYVFQFLEYLEAPVMETMLPKGKILHSFMLGTDKHLTPQENIQVTEAMEWKIEELARQNNFIGIFTTNTNPLTQQLSRTVLNYNQLKSYQINQFVAPDGTRPFKRGEDTLIAVCAFKKL